MKDYRTTHNPDDLQIVICGGGFTGIELAGRLLTLEQVMPKSLEFHQMKLKLR